MFQNIICFTMRNNLKFRLRIIQVVKRLGAKSSFERIWNILFFVLSLSIIDGIPVDEECGDYDGKIDECRANCGCRICYDGLTNSSQSQLKCVSYDSDCHHKSGETSDCKDEDIFLMVIIIGSMIPLGLIALSILCGVFASCGYCILRVFRCDLDLNHCKFYSSLSPNHFKFRESDSGCYQTQNMEL
jgi:hypothetical protein